MIEVSRNCGFTQQLEGIINEKFTDYEKQVFLRWLQVAKEEQQLKINRNKNKFF